MPVENYIRADVDAIRPQLFEELQLRITHVVGGHAAVEHPLLTDRVVVDVREHDEVAPAHQELVQDELLPIGEVLRPHEQ